MNSKQIHANINEEDDLSPFYLRFEESDDQKRIFRQWTNDLLQETSGRKMQIAFERYGQAWHSRSYGSRFFDLHGHEFQNFAINLTNQMGQPEWRQLSTSRSHANRRLLRSRVYAIGSRDDIGWDGKFIDNADGREQKKREMKDHLQSLQLFDWYAPKCVHESDSAGSYHDLEISVTRKGTQETVQELHRNMQREPKLIAWLNFAASHNVCGSYSVDFGGSQEEEVATNCDGAVLLGTVGHLVETGLKF